MTATADEPFWEVTPALREFLFQKKLIADTDAKVIHDTVCRRATARAFIDRILDEQTFIALSAPDSQSEETMTATKETDTQDKADRLLGNKGGGGVRVKDEREKYGSKRFTGRHKKSGEPIIFNGSEVELPSQLDHAMLGVMVKHAASKSLGGSIMLEPNERALLDEIAAKEVWTGTINGEHWDSIEDAGSGRVKALLDDTTSGGLYIAPVAVDQNVVTFPLLSGELFPYVDLQNLNRGRRIEGGSIANPSFTSGGSDGTDMPVFNTAAMVAAVNSTVFVENVAIEVGRDFLSDAIVEVGAILQGLLGEALAKKLDYNIALGDGTTQPEGLFTASGITTITCDNTTVGPPTLNDFSTLQFSIGKQYRAPGSCRFISNDTTYARSRGIRVDPHAVGTTVNQTPVLSDVNSFMNYMTMGWGHSVQNDIANGRCAFGNLKRYRMYRRSGLEIEVQVAGRTLALANKALITARARFAGRVIDASAFAKWTAGQS